MSSSPGAGWRPDARISEFNRPVVEEFRANGGRVGGMFAGADLLLLTTLGARTGLPHTVPLGYLRIGGRLLVVASAGGSPRHPDWYRNLLAHPDVTIETPDGVEKVHVTDLQGAERDAAWARFTESSEGFRSYEAKTSRVIPVLRLTPVD